MAAFRVVLDACVVLPQALNDLLLTLADAELYALIWTPDLLAEVGTQPAQTSSGKRRSRPPTGSNRCARRSRSRRKKHAGTRV
jgi:hypothetical protein